MTYANIQSQDGSMAVGYKPNKGHRLVFLFLGTEPKDGSKPMDAEQFLISAGWTPPAKEDAK